MNNEEKELLNQLLEEKRERELQEKQKELEREQNMIEEYSIDYVYNHPIVTNLIDKVINFINKKKEESNLSLQEVIENSFKELDRQNLNELID